MKTLQHRIADSIRKNPDAPDHRIAKNLRTVVSAVREVRETLVPIPLPSEAAVVPSSKGVSLEGKLIAMKKPADSIASNFSRLPKGQGFRVSDLSLTWGASEETIRRHAKAKNCLRFVDLGDGDWQPMVMHPETAMNLT
jgi:hypothetical protein